MSEMPEDYLAQMVNMAGGEYIFSDLNTDKDRYHRKMNIESFYEKAKDADYVIYIWSLGGKRLHSVILQVTTVCFQI